MFPENEIWSYAAVAVAILAGIIVAKLFNLLTQRLVSKLEKSGRVNPELGRFASASLRALIWLLFGLYALTVLLTSLGLQADLYQLISSAIVGNAARISIMAIIVIAGYVALRVFTILIGEYRRRTKLHPLTVELVYNMTKYLIYAIVAVLLFTNILVMAGLETLAGTLVTLFTVFVGLVVSFAATGSIGNALAGFVIMSWRPYRDGDRVEVGGGIYGDVIELDVMFTRIRTIKNEVVHVPNSQVLVNKIVNYSALPRVVVHQRVSLGYDVPRKKVEALLLDSARVTEGILTEPEPFILIRNLDNNYVEYEVNGYTNMPNRLVEIYSALMTNILDKFNQASVEILSPTHITLHNPKE